MDQGQHRVGPLTENQNQEDCGLPSGHQERGSLPTEDLEWGDTPTGDLGLRWAVLQHGHWRHFRGWGLETRAGHATNWTVEDVARKLTSWALETADLPTLTIFSSI